MNRIDKVLSVSVYKDIRKMKKTNVNRYNIIKNEEILLIKLNIFYRLFASPHYAVNVIKISLV